MINCYFGDNAIYFTAKLHDFYVTTNENRRKIYYFVVIILKIVIYRKNNKQNVTFGLLKIIQSPNKCKAIKR